MRSSIRLSPPAQLVMHQLNERVTRSRPGWKSGVQEIFRTSLVLGALEPPTRRDGRLRRTMDGGGEVYPLLLDRAAEHALSLLHPRWFGNVSAAVEWALLAHPEETLAFLTQLTPDEQATYTQLVLSLT